MEGEDIKSRLLKSAALESLRAEQEVVAAFKRVDNCWLVDHAPSYRDVTTGKSREIDVRARRSWTKGRGVTSHWANLDVLVEVKSLKGFHLVFAAEPNDRAGDPVQAGWIGYAIERMVHVLREGGVGQQLISDLEARLTDLAYPNGTMVARSLMIKPPNAPVYATAFRETNIGSSKELDSSVLWKAIQSLSSAVDSYRQRLDDILLSDLGVTLSWAVPEGRSDVADLVARNFETSVRSLTLYHPAVVVDARLWVSLEDRLDEVEHARVVLADTHPARWFDVVTRRYVNQWIRQLAAHYNTQLAHPDEAVWRERDGGLLQLMSLIFTPNVDIEIKARKRHAKGPWKSLLLKTYRRRKGAKSVPAMDTILKSASESDNKLHPIARPRRTDPQTK